MEIRILNNNDIEKYLDDLENIFDELEIKKENNLVEKLKIFIKEDNCICIGAIENNELLGILWSYIRKFAGEQRYHINYFSVKSSSRRKGIGKLLLEELKKIAKINKIKILDLNVDLNNIKAKNFYQREGFLEEKILYKLNLGDK